MYISLLFWALLGWQAANQLRPATVHGTVLAADTGRPVGRALVVLWYNSTTRSGTTDANGRYEIQNIDPGPYSAAVSKPGFVYTEFNGRRWSPLSAGEDRGIDFLMARANVISGTVFDEHGEALRGIAVQAMMKASSEPRMPLRVQGWGTSDDRGRYRIHDLAAGRYYVQAVGNQRSDLAPHYASVLYRNANTLADAQSINLTEGNEAAGVNFSMREPATYNISGRMIDATTGQAAASVSIRLEWDGNPDGHSDLPTITLANGEFLFQVTPGSYRLVASHSDAGGRQSYAKRVVNVSNRNIDHLTISLSPAATIKGRLIAAGGKLPTSITSITLLWETPIPFGRRAAVPAADGSFEFADVRPGSYELSLFRIAGEFFVSAISENHRDITDTFITVPEATPVIEVSLTLDAGPGRVIGTAYDTGKSPLVDCNLAMFSADPKKRETQRYFQGSRTGPQGRFVFRDVIPGDYLIVLWPGGDPIRLRDPDVVQLAEKFGARVSVPVSGTATVDLRLDPELQRIARRFP